MAPTERSIPAVSTINVWPMASAAMIAVCWMMIDSVPGCAKRGLMMVKTIMATISTSSGLIAGWECSRCCMRCTGDCCRRANCSAAVAGAWVSTLIVASLP